ncbi:TPA: methionyl-tRNA formyltransferase [Candidatus Delongbacteria bacterium]|nr:MAG: methionyl-tRNA formyltransferase [Candidatus Delongbacteria bacterium GWF2_40_14]HAQ61897.1 methionyl-tRNA formyltransferase [Candidatus Delongbacteria bacterium]
MGNPSIIFMGSPDFAVPSLEALCNKGITVKAVVTQPDKQKGRGKKVSFTPVKELALKLGIPVLQPVKMRDLGFINTLKELNADLFVIVAFRILPAAVLEIPVLGSVNLHASLLPDYRGAAPINHALFNGETETGVTVFFLNDREVDSGDIVKQVKIPILSSDNYGSLYNKLSDLGKDVLSDSVEEILSGSGSAVLSQRQECIKQAPKLFAENFIIDWNWSAEVIYNRIRGLSPKPGAFSSINGKRIKIIEAAFDNSCCSMPPGTVLEADRKKGFMRISTGSGILTVTRVQLESRPAADAGSFLNGNRLEPGMKFANNP